MLILLISLSVLTVILIDAVIQARANAPVPLAGRDCDVLTRQRSTVDAVMVGDYSAAELQQNADTLRRIIRESTGTDKEAWLAVRSHRAYAALCEELADRRVVERRLETERLTHARDRKTVRAHWRVAV